MKNQNTLIGIGIVLAVLMITLFGVQGVKNNAILLEEQIIGAKSDTNIQEKRRDDLIYNLVDVVKEYDKHESDTLKGIVEAREGTKTTKDMQEIKNAIKVSVEAYPELKSNVNYKQLMNELSITENLIANYRSNYNKQIKEYNRYTRQFPKKQFLNILGYETIDYHYLEFDAPQDAPRDLFKDKE